MGNVGEAAKNKFLEPLRRNDVGAVYSLFHPDLKAKVELPVLKQFVNAAKESLGAFVKVDRINIEKLEADQSKTQSGKLIFEKGTLEYSVSFGLNNHIMAFNLHSPTMSSVWLTKIETATYVERSLRMISAFYKGDDTTVSAEFHPNLRQIVPPASLQAMIKTDLSREELGPFIAVTPNNIPTIQETFYDESDGEPKLTLSFRVERESAIVSGIITWVLQSMVGTIVAFNFGKDVYQLKREPKVGEGKNLSKSALQAIATKNIPTFLNLTMKSLRDQTEPNFYSLYFARHFPGNPTESIDASIAKATEKIETLPSGLKHVIVTGLLAFEKFNLKYTFIWLNYKIFRFELSPDSTTHLTEYLIGHAKSLKVKCQHFLSNIIEMNKINEAKALISPSVLQQKITLLDKTQALIREKIKTNFNLVKIDVQVKMSPEFVWRVPIKIVYSRHSFSGWIDWQLDPTEYVLNWEIVDDEVLANAIRAPLWETLQKKQLRLLVQKAVNLPLSDPYVVFSLRSSFVKRSDKVKGTVIKKTTSPVWNEVLTLSPGLKGAEFSASDIIKVEVMGKDKISDDFLGQCQWELSEIITLVVEKGEVVMPFALKDKKDGKARGEIYLKFVFNSQ